MAGSAWFTAILDACVLYPQLVRDVLMRLTFAGMGDGSFSSVRPRICSGTGAACSRRRHEFPSIGMTTA